MRILFTTFLFVSACAPTVAGKALVMTGKSRRVAVTGAVANAYTAGVENSILALAQGKLSLLSRQEQHVLGKEKELQYSGDFSDDQVVSLGRQLGAEWLFVVRDDTQKIVAPVEPSLENCNFTYGDGSFDDEAKKAKNAEDRKRCEARNEQERKRAAAAPPHVSHRYRTNVRVIDVATGEVLGFGDADVADGQAGLTCVYPCTRDAASDLSVRAILGIPQK